MNKYPAKVHEKLPFKADFYDHYSFLFLTG
ncbi:hypothetical protein NIES4073_57330 [Kalymmatonema gypsitolerans NIES-4073]|nr:hypothetical protein NIES4073_57330 [Scytonema sp. NIES-4073]